MRDIRVGIALTREELEQIKSKAESLGLTIAEFLRFSAFKFIKSEVPKQ